MGRFDSFVEPENYEHIDKKAFEAIYTGHYLGIDKKELPEIQIATGALIASILEKMIPKEEARIVKYADDSRSLITEPTWCILVYSTPYAGIKDKRFKATKSEWDSSIAFNIRENFFDLYSAEIPLFVARCRYTLTEKQVTDIMKTGSGRMKMLQEYCETLFIVEDEDGERIVKPEGKLTNEEKGFFDQYKTELFGKDGD